MPKQKFEASEGLLHDVMTKQSGVIEKAWLEALMNSVDAGATEVEFIISESRTHISDNGDSMGKEEIEKYFKNFGKKDDDIEDKEFGKFRMGRGQIFNFGVNIWRARENTMVVSIRDEEVSVNLPHADDGTDESIIDLVGDQYTLDTEGLGYSLLDSERFDEGLAIEVHHYDDIDSVRTSVNEFKKYARYVSWVHDVEVQVAADFGEDKDQFTISNEPEVIQETELAWYVEPEDSRYNRCEVYNKGAFVDDFSLGPVSLAIITKRDLDVTLDRTDILDTDQYWQSIQEEYEEVIELILLEQEVSQTEANWLLKRAKDDDKLLSDILGKPMLRDVNNERLSIKDISGCEVSFSNRDDKVAQEAARKGNMVMLLENHRDAIEEFSKGADETISQSDILEYADALEDSLDFEMQQVKESALGKRKIKRLTMIREAMRDLGFRGRIKPGYSKHLNVWKDDSGDLFISKDFLDKNKNQIATDVLVEVVRVWSHSGDSRSGFDEDYSLYSNFYSNVVGDSIGAEHSLPEVQRKIMESEY